MIATHTPEPKIGFHTWNRFLCGGWRLIANLLLTRLASMFACKSGASRQFDTYLMDKVVMQILEGKSITWTKDIGQKENITQCWLSRSKHLTIKFSLIVFWGYNEPDQKSCIFEIMPGILSVSHDMSSYQYLDSFESWVLARATCFNFSIFLRIVGFCSWMLKSGS